MWSAGEFDEYKNRCFNGKNIDLDDYTVGFECSGEGASESLFMTIKNKGSGCAAYIKEGPVVVVNSGDSVDWDATNAANKVMEAGPLKYENLPGNTITISVKFTDGQILTQNVELSFDKEGNILAVVKE